MAKSLYAPHFMASSYNHRQLLRDWQPAVALLLHPSAEAVSIIREESPGTIIVGRMYRDDHWYSEGIKDNPVGFAAVVHGDVMATDWWQMVDYVQTNNEVMQSYHWIDGCGPGEIERLAAFSMEWMKLAQGVYSCAIGSFSVGNPDIEKGWPLFYAAMRQALGGGHVLLIHEYGWPDFWHPDNYHLGRYASHVWPILPADLKSLPVIFGEFGYDRLIENVKGGWRSTGMSPVQVAEQLHNYHNDLNAWRAMGMNLLGVCMYCIDPGGGWDDYDFAHGWDDSPIAHYVKMLPEEIVDVGGAPPPIEPDPPIDPEPEPDPDPPEEDLPMFERRISPALQDLNLTLEPVDITGLADSDFVWVLKDAWTTYNGSWEDNGHVWACPGWAKADYLLPVGHQCYFDDAGADHHIFGALLPDGFAGGNVECSLLKDAGLVYWTDPDDLVAVNTKAHSGWGHVVMYGSSMFYPDQGAQGPWRWTRGGGGFGAADVLVGAGMPANHHVSFFGVWQKMTVARYKEDVLGDNPVDPPPISPPPADGDILEYLSAILSEISRLADHLGA